MLRILVFIIGLIHTIWGLVLLFPLDNQIIPPLRWGAILPDWAQGTILLVSATLAFWALLYKNGCRPTLKRLILLLPQQALVIFSVSTNVLYILNPNSFGYGWRDPVFVFCNQLPLITLATLHTFALFRYYKQPWWRKDG